MTSLPGKCHIDASGRLRGPIQITYNDPFPCVNGTPGGGASVMQGVVMHTMVGDLPGTIKVFNDPKYQASAFFGIAQDGQVHQFGPVGQNWEAWAQMAGNPMWYSIEHADHGNTENPLTQQQVSASAQIVEALSAFAGFPLQVTDSVNGKGYGTHVMGGAAWGGHTCPGPGPRAQQRYEIITLAKQIRGGWQQWTTDGKLSLSALAQATGTLASTILRKTVEHDGVFPDNLAGYINAGDLMSVMPAGIILQVPRHP